MSRYVAPAMVMTPWGDATALRERQLPPGRGRAKEEVSRNQKERLFAAMVALAPTKDYHEITVADLVRLSGVSSRSFYELFRDKEECMVATVDEIMRVVGAVAEQALAAAPAGASRAGLAIETFIRVIAAQPAAARLCMVTALAAGPRPRARMDEAITGFAGLLHSAIEEMPDHDGVPAELTEAILGGIALVLYERLANGDPQQIADLTPDLQAWALSIPSPPGPLRPRRRWFSGEHPPSAPPLIVAERILRSFAELVAEKGFAATTVADIAARARISQNTFYKHFRDKRQAFDAALESSGAQMVAATVPAVRRHGKWPGGVRLGLEAGCAFLASERHFAYLRDVEAYALGPEAVRQRDRATWEVLELLRETVPPQARPKALEVEAILGAFKALLYRRVGQGRWSELGDVPPLITYLILCRSAGAQAAWEAAVE